MQDRVDFLMINGGWIFGLSPCSLGKGIIIGLRVVEVLSLHKNGVNGFPSMM